MVQAFREGAEAAGHVVEVYQVGRMKIAGCLGCEPREIIFTSGGSEADNQAIISAARYGARKDKKHIISTAFEHHAVLHTLEKLKKEGYEITLLDVYNAVESVDNGVLFHFHENPNQLCPVGRNIHAIMDSRLQEIQTAMEAKMRAMTLSEIMEDANRLLEL